jgi:hypothetical protein
MMMMMMMIKIIRTGYSKTGIFSSGKYTVIWKNKLVTVKDLIFCNIPQSVRTFL